ncbi:MAG: hypothetical protein IJV55_07195 [Paludibacteraceae bacterium]|nr:hypothetical protein [Paludibacteraceae bacterium]
MKKKIKYNADFLTAFVEKVTHGGRQTRTAVVAAMNKDGSLSGDEKEKQVTLTQLSRWVKTGRAPQLERICSLVNNFEGVSLSDFFVEEQTGEAVKVSPRKGQRATTDEAMTDLIKQKDELITKMQESALRQMEIMNEQQAQIAQMQSTIASLTAELAETKAKLAQRNGRASLEKGAMAAPDGRARE